MYKFKFVMILAVIFVLVLPFSNTSYAKNTENNYIVTFNNNINQQYINSKGGEVIESFDATPSVLVKATDEEINDIKLDANIIEKVEIDGLVEASSDDFDFGSIDIDPEEQLIPWNVNYVKADKAHRMGLTGRGIKIGVIDSGITNHKDIKVTGGINIIDQSANYNDETGHGTRVAGIIGAVNNSYGLIGVSPNASLYAIKVLNSNGKGSISDVIAGLEYAIENKLDIVNLSLQTTIDNSVLKETIKKANKNGILVIAAAGNYGGSLEENTIAFPAAYKDVISVGAVNHNGERYNLSSTGKELDLVAPGEYVYTTVLEDMFFLANGTSMAAPHVTGAAALLLEDNPKLKTRQLEKILLKSADRLGDFKLYGKGLLNIDKAIKLAK
ncbi:S8 family peptidase [Metabacillus niabensis]|uniref:S8 family peptidase n=1 Tax=Metabacillus niabensis TaxID=324854 RepID=UPI00399FA6AC